MEIQLHASIIELNKISEWLKLNRLTLNVQKTKYMLFKTSKKQVQTLLLQMDNTFFDKVLDFNAALENGLSCFYFVFHLFAMPCNCCMSIITLVNNIERYM